MTQSHVSYVAKSELPESCKFELPHLSKKDNYSLYF